MIASSSIISCNHSTLPLKFHYSHLKSITCNFHSKPNHIYKHGFSKIPPFIIKKHILKSNNKHILKSNNKLPIRQTSLKASQTPKDSESGKNGGEEDRDWTTSFLLFAFYAGLMYYVFFLAPNQTPSTDMYFLKKLLNLTGDDGFEMNQVIVSLWYIMGLWPLVYSMLLLPTARSSKSRIPVWPFVSLSFFGGAYALIPYFVLWRPPAPPVEESELRKWPLNFLESKITAGIAVAAGLGIIVYACSSGGDEWREYFQYFKGSKFIHITSIDFSLLSTFAPFWVYNDMTARKQDDKGSWLLPLSVIPFLGPALYLLLRPPLSVTSTSSEIPLPDEK